MSDAIIDEEKHRVEHALGCSKSGRESKGLRRWVFAAVRPGVRNGQTLTVEYLYQMVKASGVSVLHLPIRSRVGRRWPLVPHVVKLVTTVRAALGVRGCTTDDRIYYAPNAGWGLLIDLVFFLIAGRTRGRFVVHHHCSLYVERHSRLAATMLRLIPQSACHVLPCERLAEQLCRQYGSRQTLSLSYSFMAKEWSLRKEGPREGAFTLGHLSNLSVEKGLEKVLRLSAWLREQGHAHRLLLAGPFERPADRMVFDRLGRGNPCVEYLGPVYGDAKVAFYRGLDLFLFPSTYRKESWGIVVTEATASGVPTLGNDVGCVCCQVPPEYLLSGTDEEVFEGMRDRVLELMELKRDRPEAFAELGLAFRRICEANVRLAMERLEQFQGL